MKKEPRGAMDRGNDYGTIYCNEAKQIVFAEL